MARKTGSTISQEELYPDAEEPVRGDMDDARMLDLDAEEESPFLRGQKRVPVRRGSIPKKAATRLLWASIAAVVAASCAIAFAALYHYGERNWRFRVISSSDIEIEGLQNVTRSQVLEVMGGDIGRNIFFVPLAQRKAALEQIPWVASASVMRFVPNRLRIDIVERTPIAFARIGSKIMLVDAQGTLMDLPRNAKYSFPVIVGMNSAEPPSTRNARMKIYNDLVEQLESDGAHYVKELSEVDLSDPDDVKVLANNSQGEVLVHLGSSDYLDRYKTYVGHLQEWREKFDKIEAVDLRYGGQIIVNPDSEQAARPVPLSPRAIRAAMSAGVKQAALVHREVPLTKPIGPTPVFVGPVPNKKKKTNVRVKAVSKKTKHPNANAKKHEPKASAPTRMPSPKSKAEASHPSTANGKPLAVSANKKKPSPEIKVQEN